MTIAEIRNKVQHLEAAIVKATEHVVRQVQKMNVPSDDVHMLHTTPFAATVNWTAAEKAGSLSAEAYNIEAQRNEVIAILRGCSFDSAIRQPENLTRTGIMPRSKVKAHPEFVKALRRVLHEGKR